MRNLRQRGIKWSADLIWGLDLAPEKGEHAIVYGMAGVKGVGVESEEFMPNWSFIR